MDDYPGILVLVTGVIPERRKSGLGSGLKRETSCQELHSPGAVKEVDV
jgi:hypothetical protein